MISLPVNDLPEPDRRSLENLLGHPLEADQQVFVLVFSAGQVSDSATRRAATQNIRSALDKADHHRTVRGITDDEVDAALDEAMGNVRPRPG